MLGGCILWRRSAKRNEDMRLIAEGARDGVIIQAIDGTILWANPAFCKLTGFAEKEVLGRSPLEFLVPEESRPSPAEIRAFRFNEGDPAFTKLLSRENVRKDGSKYHVQIGQAFLNRSKSDRKYGRRVVTTVRDISEGVKRDKALMDAQFDMIDMIQTDPLTGLYSRAFAQNWLQERMAEKPAVPFAAISIDIVNSLQISETLGFAVTDAIITHVGQTIRLSAPENAIVSRSGDDSFLLIIPEDFTLREVIAIWNKISGALDMPVRIDGGLKSVSVSAGIALHPGPVETVTGFMQSIHAARAHGMRRRGRNLGYYSAALHERASRLVALRQDLPAALSGQDIHFNAQPVFVTSDLTVAGFELLVRWTHPTFGPVPPNDFLPIAEELGLMDRFDKLAAQEAISLQKQFSAQGLGSVKIGFNLSADGARSPDFATWLEWQCDAKNVEPGKITIEILETTVFTTDFRSDSAAAQIERMRRAGFNVFLDDFGVGYAGLAHLSGLSTTGLKIDKSLIDDVCSSQSARTIVDAILTLCANLGLESIAEGIEDPEQLDILRKSGCPRVQGFGIARPMPSTEAVSWTKAWIADVPAPIPGQSAASECPAAQRHRIS